MTPLSTYLLPNALPIAVNRLVKHPRRGLSKTTTSSKRPPHTHQQSTDPRTWTTVDQHLHSLHMRPPPEPTICNPLPCALPSPTIRQASPPQDKAICRNYNMANKGCPYQNCIKRHICILCNSDSQTLPVFQCAMHSAAASPSK